MADALQKKVPRSRDSLSNTLLVAIGVSLLCSVLVSATAVVLKPQQARNEELYRQRIVLEVAGLYEPGVDVGEAFGNIELRLVELASGVYADGDYIDGLDSFDAGAAAKDPASSTAVPAALDIAGIRRRALHAPVYLVRDAGRISQVILPVYGSGLWSTMYGYLALEGDGNTIRGLRFYEHAETPGLGDQIDRPDWRAQWNGKALLDEAGELRIEVVRGQAPAGDDARFMVDGLAGATLTGRGVSNLLRYWTGEHGFGPYLAKLKAETVNDG